MIDSGLISFLPVLTVLGIAFIKKDVFTALITGLILSSCLIGFKSGNFLAGADAVPALFSSASTAEVLFFFFLMGAVFNITEKSGGVEGLVTFCTEKQKLITSAFGAQLFTFLTGVIVFIDSLGSVIVTAGIGKPFFKKYNIPAEKLAFIANSTGAAICWLIPLSGTAAVLTAALSPVLEKYSPGTGAYETVIRAIPYQFYTWALLILVLATILTGKEIGPMRRCTESLRDVKLNSNHKLYGTCLPEGKQPLARNVVLPVLFMLLCALSMIIISGNGNILQGNISNSLFVSVILTLILSCVFFKIQGIMSVHDFVQYSVTGMRSLFDVVLIFVLAYSFGSTLEMLNMPSYAAHYASYFPEEIFAAAVLLTAAAISYSTGTSNGTAVLLVPIIIPSAVAMDFSIPCTVGAIVSGAVFGDQNSPVSDSVITTASFTGIRPMEHVKTQTPYTLVALSAAAAGYVLLSLIA